MSCTPQGTSTPVLGLCKPVQGETSWAAAMNSNMDILDALLQQNFAAGSSIALSVASGVLTITNTGGGTIVNNHLTGFTLGNDVNTPNTIVTIAAGQCADSTNGSYISGSAFSKTTTTFVVGSGNGGIAPGLVLSPSTWYHAYAAVVSSSFDVFFDVSTSASHKPGGTTAFRRIGAIKTDGSSNVLPFVQDGDYLRWKASVLDSSVTAQGTSAASITLASVPTGVTVQAILNVQMSSSGGTTVIVQLSDLAANDEAPSDSLAPLATLRSNQSSITDGIGQVVIRTNTSAQIRSRWGSSDGSTVVRLVTLGWYDTRGK